MTMKDKKAIARHCEAFGDQSFSVAKKVMTLCLLVGFGVFLSVVSALGQSVGIGINSPHPSARLHIFASDKGVLFPNVGISSLTNPSPISSAPAEGLFIFNDGSGGVTPRGFYWWDGAKWRYLIDSVSTSGPIVGDGTPANPVGLQSGTSAGDILIWDGSQWMIGPAPFDSVCNTAMANYVQKWTGTKLCNSIIYDDGVRVGIGTNNPQATLEISGNLSFSGAAPIVYNDTPYVCAKDSSLKRPMILFERSNRDMEVLLGRTASPVSAGHVPRLSFMRAAGILSAPLPTRGDQWLGVIQVGGYDTTWSMAGVGGGCEAGILFASGGDWSPVSHPVKIHFKVIDTGSVCGQYAMTVNHNGFVGINITSPTERLDVRGKIYTSDGLKPNFESPWMFVLSGNDTTLFFYTGFLPTRVTVLVQYNMSSSWTDTFSVLPPCFTTWDDLFTLNLSCYYLSSTGVFVYHNGSIYGSPGSYIVNGSIGQRIKVLAWK